MGTILKHFLTVVLLLIVGGMIVGLINNFNPMSDYDLVKRGLIFGCALIAGRYLIFSHIG